MVITYPRPCPACGKKLKTRSAFSRHRKYCGKKTEPVPCPYCESKFKRKDDMSKHVRKFHSEGAKRKAEESIEEDPLYCFCFLFPSSKAKSRGS